MDEEKKQKASIFINVMLIFCFSFFIISFSTSLVIWIRPFYYNLHLKNIDIDRLEFKAGKLNYDELKYAYDELLDFLTYSSHFGIGKLQISESAKDHFYDVKLLFIINFVILALSFSFISISFVLKYHLKFNIDILKFWFIASILIIVFFIVLLVSMAINFDKTFEIFHLILFRGKTNWRFNYNNDEIIKILREDYFRNCAIFIGSTSFALCLSSIISVLVKRLLKIKLINIYKSNLIYIC